MDPESWYQHSTFWNRPKLQNINRKVDFDSLPVVVSSFTVRVSETGGVFSSDAVPGAAVGVFSVFGPLRNFVTWGPHSGHVPKKRKTGALVVHRKGKYSLDFRTANGRKQCGMKKST